MTNALAIIEKKKDAITAVLPQGMDPERFIQMANSVSRNKSLARCSPESVAMCIYGCANLGLYPDPVLKHVYLIPFGGKATIVMGYGGYIELAARSKQLGRVYTSVVYEGEEWEYWVDENGAHIKHIPDDSKANNNKILRAYCVSRVRGDSHVEIVSMADCEKLKTFGSNPIWKNEKVAMMRKTAIIRSAKVWPLTDSLGLALHYDQQAELGKDQFENDRAMRLNVKPLVAEPDDLLADDVDGEVIDDGQWQPADDEMQSIIDAESEMK